MKPHALLLFCILLTISGFAQEKQYSVSCVAFYNLENLFDLVDDTTHWDDQFTPLGENLYNQKVYDTKLKNLSKVISEIGTEMTPDGPALLGVAEIETKSVLEDLAQQESIASRNYSIIHFESKDFRGIDVALMYNPKYYLPEASFNIPLITRIEEQDTSYSRDVLFSYGQLAGERVLISVNHWPSRRGGEKATAHLRNKAAKLNRTVIDSLKNLHGIDKVIVMGDMNDDPTNESMKKYLSAKSKKEGLAEDDFFNPMWKYYKKGFGTTAWRDAWSLFDQIAVSAPLVEDKEGLHFYQAKVFSKKWLVQKTGQFKGYPFRTYAGGKFLGGYSDHFPVYSFFIKEI